MPPTVHSLGIDKFSRDERLDLVQEIWDSIAAESTPSFLTESQRFELQRRAAEDDAHPEDAVPWEQVKAETMARLKT
jgi:putative addiction module component (TIGR02574 family)